MQLIAPGLWRWTAPRPAWKPGAAPDSPDDWERDVGSVLYQTPHAAVFVDPLLPGDGDAGLRLNPESWMRDLSIGRRELHGLLDPALEA